MLFCPRTIHNFFFFFAIAHVEVWRLLLYLGGNYGKDLKDLKLIEDVVCSQEQQQSELHQSKNSISVTPNLHLSYFSF